jgi:hypothetical protein
VIIEHAKESPRVGRPVAPEGLQGELPAFDDLNLHQFAREVARLGISGRGILEWDIILDGIQEGYLPGWPETYPAWWQSMGPSNINGRIKALAIHPMNSDVVWAGAANGGVWKTINGGVNWQPTMGQELSLAIGALAVAPSDPSRLYAGTGEDAPGWVPTWPGVGVYRSTDGGSTWTLRNPIDSSRCTRILVHPTDPNIVWVAGNKGLHLSPDGGASWTNRRTDHVSDALLDPDNPNRVYAAVWYSGVWRSLNGGSTWTQLDNGIPTEADAGWIKLAMGRNGTSGTGFLLAKMGPDSGDIYRSRDGGDSWIQLATDINPADYNEWTNTIAVDPNNHNRILTGGVGMQRSTNGSTFTKVTGIHSDKHAVVYGPTDSSVVYVATDGGVYKSTDSGASWTLQSYLLMAAQLYSMGVSQTDPLFVGSATQDDGIITTDGSAAWNHTSAGNEGGIFSVDPNNASVAYTTPWNVSNRKPPGNLRRTTNGGANWTTLLVGTDPDIAVEDVAIQPFNSNRLLCVAGDQIFRSTNQGTTWSAVATTIGQAIRVLFAPSDPNRCYVAARDYYGIARLYRSTSAGSAGSWVEPYAPSNGPQMGQISAIAVSASSPGRIYLGYAGYSVPHVLRSNDGGAHWSNASGTGTATLPDIPINALALHPLNSDVIYAASDIGMFRSRDGGVTWANFNEGWATLPRTFVSGLVMRRKSRMLYASTMGRGTYRRRVWTP